MNINMEHNHDKLVIYHNYNDLGPTSVIQQSEFYVFYQKHYTLAIIYVVIKIMSNVIQRARELTCIQ